MTKDLTGTTWGTIGRAVTTVTLLVVASGSFTAVTGAGTGNSEPVLSNDTFARVADLAKASVVNISSRARARKTNEKSPLLGDPLMRRFFGEEFERRVPDAPVQGMGSGVIISADGYIVTNNHVIDGADDIRVLLPDKRTFRAKIIGTDPPSDVAVIKIDAPRLRPLPWADSKRLRVGELVLAVGNPFGLNETVTMGIISAVGRANMGIVDYEDFIQTDAAINPGNSGGALVNLNGELMGINTAIFSQSGGSLGIGFAIPSNLAKGVLTSLIQHGKVIRGWMGVSIQDLTEDLAKNLGAREPKGALVAEVLDGSPASKGKLEPGEIIVDFNGHAVTDGAQLRSLVAETPPGTQVKVTVLKDGRPRQVTMTIGELPSEVTKPSRQVHEDAGHGEHALVGVTVEPAPSEHSGFFRRKESGVVVSDIEPESPAERAGLRPGDVIREINRLPVKSVRDFEQATRNLNPGDRALVLVKRGEASTFLSINPEPAA